MDAYITARFAVDTSNLNRLTNVWANSIVKLTEECKSIVAASNREYSIVARQVIDGIQSNILTNSPIETGYNPYLLYDQIMTTLYIIKINAAKPVKTSLTNVSIADAVLHDIVAFTNRLGRVMADWYLYIKTATNHIKQLQAFVNEFPASTLSIDNMIQHLHICLEDHDKVTDNVMHFLSNF